MIPMTSTHLVHVENTTGRKKGCPNYKKDILLNVISDVLPAGQVGWTTVANRYMIATSENLLRDGVDIKRHFIEKLCNKNKKPTGESGPVADIKRAQEIYRRILVKESSSCVGGTLSDESDEDLSPS